MEQLGDSGLEALVRVGDHQPDTAKAALSRLAQKRRPECFRLRRADVHAEHFAATIAVDGFVRLAGVTLSWQAAGHEEDA